MMGLDAQLLDGAAPDKRVSRTAAGIFGFLMALAVLCVEEFRMAQNSPSVSAGATFHLPLGLVPTSLAKSAGSDCQLFLASHYINDPKIFKAFMDGMTPEMLPKGVSSHAFLPSADGHTAFCVWEAPPDGDYTTIRAVLDGFPGITSSLTPVDDPWGVFECSK
jgi:hypothetical protein